MVRYRRNRVPGATYFFTVTLRDRNSDLLVRHVGELRTAWRRAHERYPHQVVAAVVPPEHLIAFITMAEGGCDYAGFGRESRKGFTRPVGPDGHSPGNPRFG